MTFERTTDYSLVRDILTHPAIWPGFRDDFSLPPEEFEPSQDPLIGYMLAKDGGEILGLFIFRAENNVCWWVDDAILPAARGGRAIRAALELREWVWNNTTCQRLVGCIAESNRAALWFARKIGMVRFGVNERSIMRNGKLENRILLGISRPEGVV
jgi:hypothetical protein